MSFHAERATDTFPDLPPVGPERLLAAEVRNLMAMVGELTVTLVVQGAYLSALRHGRSTPEEFDVDEALTEVADNVPDHVAEGLWAARDALVARFRAARQPV